MEQVYTCVYVVGGGGEGEGEHTHTHTHTHTLIDDKHSNTQYIKQKFT